MKRFHSPRKKVRVFAVLPLDCLLELQRIISPWWPRFIGITVARDRLRNRACTSHLPSVPPIRENSKPLPVTEPRMSLVLRRLLSRWHLPWQLNWHVYRVARIGVFWFRDRFIIYTKVRKDIFVSMTVAHDSYSNIQLYFHFRVRKCNFSRSDDHCLWLNVHAIHIRLNR